MAANSSEIAPILGISMQASKQASEQASKRASRPASQPASQSASQPAKQVSLLLGLPAEVFQLWDVSARTNSVETFAGRELRAQQSRSTSARLIYSVNRSTERGRRSSLTRTPVTGKEPTIIIVPEGVEVSGSFPMSAFARMPSVASTAAA